MVKCFVAGDMDTFSEDFENHLRLIETLYVVSRL